MKRTVYFLLTLGLFACGDDLPDREKITKIVYAFHDSSVPPEYHRSYTITAEPDHIDLVVDSYGDVLHDGKYALRDGDFDAIIDAFFAAEITTCRSSELGCDGGTGNSIEIYEEEQLTFSGTVYYCGGENDGGLCGDIRGFGKKIESFVPDLSQYTR